MHTQQTTAQRTSWDAWSIHTLAQLKVLLQAQAFQTKCVPAATATRVVLQSYPPVHRRQQGCEVTAPTTCNRRTLAEGVCQGLGTPTPTGFAGGDLRAC